MRLADAELADVRVFGAPRALGIALRVAGLARGGPEGLALLRESAATLDDSPRCSSAPARWPNSGRPCAGTVSAPRPGTRWPGRSSSRPAAAPGRWPPGPATSSGGRARPRRPWRTGVDALTPSELRVARLAADGRSNREIAGELYVTLKAIEGHLARAYAKLGIEGRGQLADALVSGKDWGADPTANHPPAARR